ncbi:MULTISPECIES: hypothetical protein [unclassified Ruegeria]|uniref:hypothetical protein n=1 Tax=unclassified Ruegeria TaxID=2625375 RepID=UPI0014896E0A|nr:MULTISPECIES: hypothetical protein [unclassified Ruegeria]
MGFLGDINTFFGDALKSGDFWLGTIVTAFLAVFRNRLYRPKIRANGCMSGGDAQFSKHSIGIVNSPSFLGFTIDRNPLIDATAWMYDPKAGKTLANMRWRDEPDNKLIKQTIEVTERRDLIVCGVHQGRVHHFVGTSANDSEKSETIVEKGQSRKLEAHLTDRFNRKQKIRFMITVSERRAAPQGVEVRVRVKTTMADRANQFRDGFKEMLYAITRPRY